MVSLSSVFLFSNLFSSFYWLFGPQDPQWLESLKSEYPLLSTSEYDFVVDVRLRSLRKTGSGTEFSKDEILKIKQNVAKMKVKFNQMVEQLKVTSSSRERFMQEFSEWITVRDFDIKFLNEIANISDSYRTQCQVSGVVGGALTFFIAGGLSSFGTSFSGPDLEQLHGIVMNGFDLHPSARTFESVLLRIEKTKETIEQDDENFEHLVKWVTGVIHLQKSWEGIKSIDVNGNLQAAAKQLADVSTKNLSGQEKEEAVGKVIESFNFPADIAEEISDFVGMLISTSLMFERYQVLFDVALKACEYMPQLRLAMNIFRKVYTSMNTIANNFKPIEPQIERVTIGMLLDVINIIIISEEDLSSIDGKQIRKAANALEKEALVFRNLYDQMKNFESQEFKEKLN